eukprot:337038-Chlamydomonas_euryale.AAC.3
MQWTGWRHTRAASWAPSTKPRRTRSRQMPPPPRPPKPPLSRVPDLPAAWRRRLGCTSNGDTPPARAHRWQHSCASECPLARAEPMGKLCMILQNLLALHTCWPSTPDGSLTHNCWLPSHTPVGCPQSHLLAARSHTCRPPATTPAGRPQTHLLAARSHTCRPPATTPAGRPQPHLLAARSHTCWPPAATPAGRPPHQLAVLSHTCWPPVATPAGHPQPHLLAALTHTYQQP